MRTEVEKKQEELIDWLEVRLNDLDSFDEYNKIRFELSTLENIRALSGEKIPEVKTVTSTEYSMELRNNLDIICKKHFHGFSSHQWDCIKDQFPYCEIKYIAKEYASQHFAFGNKELTDAEIANEAHNRFFGHPNKVMKREIFIEACNWYKSQLK